MHTRTTRTRGSTGLLIIIIFAALVVIGGLLFSSGREERPIVENTTAPEPVAAAEPRKIAVTLRALGNSLQTGEAVLRDFEGKMSVTAVISNFATSTEQPIQISLGTCANPGDLAYPLANLQQSDTTGTVGTNLGVSDTILDVSLDAFLLRGPLAITVRKMPEEAHVSVACGEIAGTELTDNTATTTPADSTATTTLDASNAEVQ